jgi:hypothetical protein
MEVVPGTVECHIATIDITDIFKAAEQDILSVPVNCSAEFCRIHTTLKRKGSRMYYKERCERVADYLNGEAHSIPRIARTNMNLEPHICAASPSNCIKTRHGNLLGSMYWEDRRGNGRGHLGSDHTMEEGDNFWYISSFYPHDIDGTYAKALMPDLEWNFYYGDLTNVWTRSP